MNVRTVRRPPWTRRSQPEQSPAAQQPAIQHDPYATQIIPAAVVARWYRRIVWVALAVSFAVSVLGNVRMFGGDLMQLVDAGALSTAYLATVGWWVALAGALLYQLVIQILQFRFAGDVQHRRLYWFLIAVSVAPSLWTFAPILDWFNDLHRIGLVWVYGGAAVVLALNDWMQEWMLHDRR